MKLKVLTTIAAFLVSHLAAASEFYTAPNKGQVLFKASALGLRFEGKGVGANGMVKAGESISGRLEFDLSTLQTGIELRDAHMKEKYLETGKFPKSELVITQVAKFSPDASEQESEFDGLLTIRGIQKPIKGGRVKIEKKQGGYQVTASFDTKMSDFEIPIPKYAGVVVRDDLHVEAEMKFEPKM